MQIGCDLLNTEAAVITQRELSLEGVSEFSQVKGATCFRFFLFGFQGRKRQFEYKKLESIHLKQQAVLKRKTEEVGYI